MKPRIGLVCSGGGARGAYEAGVIRYLREELPASTRADVRFDVLAGTSVGASTACFLAATMHIPDEQGRALASLWTGLSLEKVFRVDGESLYSVSRKIWRATRANERPEGWRLYDLFHPEPIENIVRHAIDWPRIAANLARGLCSAVSVSATRIRDGKTVIFIQRREAGLPRWSRDPYQQPVEVVLGPEHALASGAIPLLFRSARVGDEYYCDGFVRQNTPLSPALRLGADRVLILSLRHKPRPSVEPPAQHEPMPTTTKIIGKVLTALMVDRTEYDLDRLRRLNEMLESGRRAYGDDFVARMNDTLEQVRGQPYRVVRDLVVRPSRDLAELARPHLEKFAKKEKTHALPTRLLHRLSGSNLFTQAELGSYLLFDAGYANDLIALAMEDAHARREQLIEFFDPSSK
ncbi:MAG: patatin-like phospholipase family protein [Archangium sp.]|nr:patatin-like phospholipase family protein [Archangium sp.]MDP3156281.1 patatin-like phospholipase family protein [Archangium sp.]MDP3570325.1 patatin-like phospholipase family protein [Archangium sp.]